MNNGKTAATAIDVSAKVAALYQRRVRNALTQYGKRLQDIRDARLQKLANATSPLEFWSEWAAYAVDSVQRSVLFMDALRQRGNQYLEHTRAGMPPVLHFDYEIVVDGRKLDPAVNYALVRIIPPEDITVDARRRPYVIIDPRAGHGPGIGGFKDDSQVGVALREGHPVYFVIFFPQPEPGQTLLDVCAAERRFIEKVRELHPESPKPAIVGNCQGGWAAMMLAASHPQDTGPIVINGAPMSYWGGAWQEGENDNPMRYAGGMLGGTWLSSLTADLGDGVFDGAHLVQNFENLNPANTYWDKYYNVYANVDNEVPRFLEFERWWGGFYLMNREEIEWITSNLFVGNKLWKGGATDGRGNIFDLRSIKSPIVLFASMGDNITPPQQAFNWVADVYGSTAEIKSRGQVIVGLLHQNAGHLGIFVSGSVARKEHAQIVSVLKSIEALPPGLYGMQIKEVKGDDGKTAYDVEFREHELEEIIGRMNRFQRREEVTFESVAKVSDFNQRAYELLVRPLVKAMTNEASAKVMRDLHPLRAQRWSWSDMNPFLAWLEPMAGMVREQRKALDKDAATRQAEQAMSEVISASLDCYRAMRDALSEAMFFQTYGSIFAVSADEAAATQRAATAGRAEASDEVVRNAMAQIDSGGIAAALVRMGSLLARHGEAMPLDRLALRAELWRDYAGMLPPLSPDQWRTLRGIQDVIVKHAPDEALARLPRLLENDDERIRLVEVVEKLLADPRLYALKPNQAQLEMAERLRAVLGLPTGKARLRVITGSDGDKSA